MALIMNFRLNRTAAVRRVEAAHRPSEIERARSALSSLEPDCDHDEWVRIAMAAKAAGLSFDEFDRWSAQGQKYKGDRECTSVWNSIKSGGDVTERTLFYLARNNGWHDSTESFRLPSPAKKQKRGMVQREGIFEQTSNSNSNAAANAIEVWNCGQPAPEEHPYIVKKQGMADGLRVYPESALPLTIAGKNMAGWLMVPCWSADGSLQTIQFISPSGKKLNLTGSKLTDGFYATGDIVSANRIFIVEGIGQAWAVRKVTDDAAVVCFSAGRMATVASVLRELYPAVRLILLPDKGKETSGAEIARSVAGEWCELPVDKKDNYDVNDLLHECGSAAVQAVLASPQKPPMRFPLISAAEMMAAPPMDWLVHGVLPMHGLAALYGPSGSGKSFLALDLAASLAAGTKQWFGHPIKHCPVTYVCLEGQQGIKKRIDAWSNRHGDMANALGFVFEPANLLCNDDVLELANSIKAKNCHNGLVIIDTLNRATPNADENSSTDMGRIIAAASQLQTLVGGLVMLIHHTGKNKKEGLRGHSSLLAALDAAIEVTNVGHERSWRVAKCKDGEDGCQCLFRLEPVLVGNDDQGLDMTSCIVVAGSSGPTTAQHKAAVKRPRLRENQSVAKPILDEMLEQSGEMRKAGAPEGSSCIRYDDAVDAVSKHLTCEQKRRTERAKDAIDSLINHGFYRSTGEWLWRS